MMKIRKAKVKEYNIIADYQIMMAKETEDLPLDRDVIYPGVKAVFDDPNKGTYYVALLENKIIGSMLITPEWSDWRNGTVLWFQSVYVIPEARKTGAFKALYNYIKDVVDKDEQYKGLRLYVEKDNIRAQKVYKKMGMNDDHYLFFEWMPEY